MTFKSAENLKPGDPVMYKATKIGEVEKIDLAGNVVRVQVNIEAAHRAVVYREAIYVIDSTRGFFVAGRQITVKDRPFTRARTPVETGDSIAGWNGVVGKVLGKVLP